MRRRCVIPSATVGILEGGAAILPPQDAPYSIVRRRTGPGLGEELTVRNHTAAVVALELRIEVPADVVDLFGVNVLVTKGRHHRLTENGRLVLGYAGGGYLREIWITASAPEARVDEDGFVFDLRLEPYDTWTTCLDVAVAPGALPRAA